MPMACITRFKVNNILDTVSNYMQINGEDSFDINYFAREILLPGFVTKASNNIGTLFIWAMHEKNSSTWKKEKFYNVCLGKPSYNIYPKIKELGIEYWSNLSEDAIDYGEPCGEEKYREIAANGLNKWYKTTNFFTKEDIVFTVGGSTALHAIFYALNKVFPGKKIVTQTPFYPMYTGYKGDNFRNNLHLIETKKHGYVLTSEGLVETLKNIKKNEISAFLFCDPNNPTGFVVGENEWLEITKILEHYSEIPIILDEAYIETAFNVDYKSLITLSPQLFSRIILVRSATKGLSAAGERFALIALRNRLIYDEIVNFTMGLYIHPPISMQHIYSQALCHLNHSDVSKLANYYKIRTHHAYQLLKKNDIHVCHEPDGSFYVLTNLKKYLGRALNAKAAKVLNKEHIEDDVDIAYHLLFHKGVALSPLSYFGANRHDGVLRITCSGNEIDIATIIERIKN